MLVKLKKTSLLLLILFGGGFIPVGENAMREIRDFCDLHDIIMVADEVQTGFGRTGTLFAMEQFGVDLYENDKSIEVPDINANRNDYKILSWEIKAGDAIAFDFRTLHGASENVNKLSRRRIFSARIVGDDAFFVDRGGKGSPPFENIKLKTGDKLVGKEFPIIYQ